MSLSRCGGERRHVGKKKVHCHSRRQVEPRHLFLGSHVQAVHARLGARARGSSDAGERHRGAGRPRGRLAQTRRLHVARARLQDCLLRPGTRCQRKNSRKFVTDRRTQVKEQVQQMRLVSCTRNKNSARNGTGKRDKHSSVAQRKNNKIKENRVQEKQLFLRCFDPSIMCQLAPHQTALVSCP